MAEKKYYWIKLKRDFFKRHDIKIVEAMPNGKDYILFYLKLLLESIDHNGALRFSDTIPYNEQMLAVITGTNVDIVRSAMKVFISLGMIDKLEDGTIYMLETERMMDGESASAHRVREHREKLKALQCNTDVTKCNTDIEIEKDIELELESESTTSSPAPQEPPPPKPKTKRFVKPTLEEVKQYCAENGYRINCERFINYYESKGWKVGRSSMKDWRATVRNWAMDDNDSSKPKSEPSFDLGEIERRTLEKYKKLH